MNKRKGFITIIELIIIIISLLASIAIPRLLNSNKINRSTSFKKSFTQ